MCPHTGQEAFRLKMEVAKAAKRRFGFVFPDGHAWCFSKTKDFTHYVL